MAEDPFQSALRGAEFTGDWSVVISMYIEAAAGQSEAFYLTHAYIHALEVDDPRTPALRKRLVALHAETEE